MQERQLDRVADLLDLPVEAPDVAVVDVGHLLQHQLLDLALRDPLVGVRRTWLDEQRVPRPQRRVQDRVGEVHHPLLVGVGDDERPVAALKDLLEHDDLAGPLEPERVDDVQGVVEQHLLAAAQYSVSTAGETATRVRATGEDVDGAVLVPGQEHAVSARRLRQPVNLLLEGDDLRAGLLEGGDKPLVVLRQPGKLGLRRCEPLLELAHMPRALGQLPPHQGELLLRNATWVERSWASLSQRAARASASSLRATSHLPGGLAVNRGAAPVALASGVLPHD